MDEVEDLAMILCWHANRGKGSSANAETIYQQMHPVTRDYFRRQATEVIELLEARGLRLQAPTP